MIDHQTVQRIKDAANIVDVVSEFVTLKKSGANYKGLCPFHNERTPSFIVTPSRNTCHCFGCGKGGSPITFIMEHEQMDYPEALRWLAAKYHIEIRERELSQEEKDEQSRRESLFIVNEWAAKYFEKQLSDTPDGATIGMPYFRSRGFRDDIIKKFRLGYDSRNAKLLAQEALREGYKEEFIVGSGVCYKSDRDGALIDRFYGRVVFPWIDTAGRVVGFTARVLDSATKGVNQKYVNSPATEIYKKDHALYGIYQAKKAISKLDRVFLVEGQADVLAMHQCGLENTVANSGTALSKHQLYMLHKLTPNITFVYDGDKAGIQAALKGTDMALEEGMNLKILMLPDGQDPDEYARKHGAEAFRKYVEDNQVDFIRFKTQLLLKDRNDPQQVSQAISSIVKSISCIPNQILRDTYLHDFARQLGRDERSLINQMNVFIRERKEAELRRRTHAPSAEGPTPDGPDPSEPPMEHNPQPSPVNAVAPMQTASPVERMLVQEVIRHGERIIYNNVEAEDGSFIDLTVAQFVSFNLAEDNLSLKSPLLNRILQEAAEKSTQPGFNAETYFLHHDDIEISRLANELTTTRYHLSESNEPAPLNEADRKQRELEETENLRQQVTHILLDFRMEYVEQQLKTLKAQISQVASNMDKLHKIMAEYRDMQIIRNQLAKKLGSNIIA